MPKICWLGASSLYAIPKAGEWNSKAFMEYPDKRKLEDDAVREMHSDESVALEMHLDDSADEN